jgi:hypothetical protein
MPNGEVTSAQIEVTQAQLAELGKRVDTVAGLVDELNNDLKGTMDKPGAFETIRRTNDAIVELSKKTDTIVASLADFRLKEARVMGGGYIVKGLLAAICVGVGWAFHYFKR